MHPAVKKLLPLWLFCAALAGDARAIGLIAPGATPVELRIAVAIGPSRTTEWSQLRVEAPPGPLAVVVPAPAGASIDLSADAWFEALEQATAPRIAAPKDAVDCAGRPAERWQTAGDAPERAAQPAEIALLPDAQAVLAWAAQHDLSPSPQTKEALGLLAPAQFLVVRTSSPGGLVTTPTVRVTATGAAPALPLILAQATAAPLLVTAFVIAPDRGTLAPGMQAHLAGDRLVFSAESGESNYSALRQAALAEPGAFLVERAGHDAWIEPYPLLGAPPIDSVLTSYFMGAALQLGAADAAGCIAEAEPLFESMRTVAPSCPRGAIAAGAPCDETVAPGEIDPALLRCTPAVDDLAVAFSSQSPGRVWLTRIALGIGAGDEGWPVTAAAQPGDVVVPERHAHKLDRSGCASTSSHAVDVGARALLRPARRPRRAIPVYRVREGCGARDVQLEAMQDVPADDDADYYAYTEDSCSGQASDPEPGYRGAADASDEDAVPAALQSDPASSDSANSGSDSCGGDSANSGSDSCGGDSANSGSDSCGGDSANSGSDSCGGDSGGSGDSCSGGSGDCSIHRRRAPRPRLSAMTMLALCAIAPLRRRRRKKVPRLKTPRHSGRGARARG